MAIQDSPCSARSSTSTENVPFMDTTVSAPGVRTCSIAPSDEPCTAAGRAVTAAAGPAAPEVSSSTPALPDWIKGREGRKLCFSMVVTKYARYLMLDLVRERPSEALGESMHSWLMPTTTCSRASVPIKCDARCMGNCATTQEMRWLNSDTAYCTRDSTFSTDARMVSASYACPISRAMPSASTGRSRYCTTALGSKYPWTGDHCVRDRSARRARGRMKLGTNMRTIASRVDMRTCMS